MSPRVDVSEQRREQILAAAETVVADKGLDSLRMDEVADRTGLSKGTLYLYFRNKHDLSLALLERVLEQELDAVEGISATAADAENALRACFGKETKTGARIGVGMMTGFMIRNNT